MPSQSSLDGLSMPDHLMVIGSPDFLIFVELREMDTCEEDED